MHRQTWCSWWRRAESIAFLSFFSALAAGCGEQAREQTPFVAGIPDWAQVAGIQVSEAQRLGIPVAFQNGIGMRFVLIPAGTFMMGCPEDEEGRWDFEGPQHEVTLPAFYLAVTEVTNAQYRRFIVDHDSGEWDGKSFDGETQPVVNVSHEDATAFVRWLSEREGGAVYRLPSEAEWEYACRAGTTTRYWSGDDEEDLARVGWYGSLSWRPEGNAGNSGDRTHAVGEKAASPWGLYDVHGNVAEWCEDMWHDSYSGAPVDGSAWVQGGSGFRVVRGGSWFLTASYSRSGSRGGLPPGYRRHGAGIRPARDVAREEE